MATEARAQELIVGCLAASAAVAAGSSLATGNLPGMRLVVGIAFTGAALATVSQFAPGLAGSFAVLVLTSTVFTFGAPLMDAVTALTAGATTGATSTPAPAPKKGTLSA